MILIYFIITFILFVYSIYKSPYITPKEVLSLFFITLFWLPMCILFLIINIYVGIDIYIYRRKNTSL